jgi:hypothetical protein
MQLIASSMLPEAHCELGDGAFVTAERQERSLGDSFATAASSGSVSSGKSMPEAVWTELWPALAPAHNVSARSSCNLWVQQAPSMALC